MTEQSIVLRDFYQIRLYHVKGELNPSSWSWQKEPHSHDHMELAVHIAGNMDILAEGNLYRHYGGEIRLYASGELHCGILHTKQNMEWYQLMIPLDFLNCKDGKALSGIFFERAFGEGNVIYSKRYEEIVRIFQNIFELYETREPLFECYCRSALVNLLCLVKLGGNRKKADIRKDSALQKILNLICTEYCELTTVREIAERTHFSVSYINKIFREQLCISPYQFLLCKKFNEAKRALKEGKNVTEACQIAGFHDYSNFITAFRRRFGVTPNRYV